MKEHSLFDLLVLSLGNAALIGLGIVPEPGSQTKSKDIEAAKYNIDLLETLQKKTKGNLTSAEDEMLTSLLYDLRLKFLEARK
ncbi:DUF1844 domain-containing protein [Silvanigrella aquatica]|uniref:DUF1844 domain-containing protein n=1 Tax=Silvanigrella aquatica TaxID=1915309 RepID=A0A1L4D2J3_9BACT|nr:DUF1844 domain-containing protein [Silvanigrella aquatica]APJ04418.1 hypothetical protein AXG55_11070 [Silvanigrella aquatica]